MDPRLVVVVGYPDAELLDIAGVTSSLVLANDFGGAQPPYKVIVATPGGRPITYPPGLTLQVQHALERLAGRLDTVVVSGGRGCEAVADDPALVAHVRRIARRSRRVASVCTGATILTATGLLDGRRATTHWGYAGRLAARYPAVTVDPRPIYIRDGNVVTAAGVTSALDLALALIEEDHGPDTARRVARELVTYMQRPGNQAQVSMFVATPPPEHGLVRRVADHVASHLDSDLTTTTLAAMAGVSTRHLTRLFVDDVGQTPGRYVRRAGTRSRRPAPRQQPPARGPRGQTVWLRVPRDPPPGVRRRLRDHAVALSRRPRPTGLTRRGLSARHALACAGLGLTRRTWARRPVPAGDDEPAGAA